jgi:outer membrane protein OmpA-like peptidoglycan-associated protein
MRAPVVVGLVIAARAAAADVDRSDRAVGRTVERDRDPIGDDDAPGCRAEHARGPTATCPRFARLTATAIEVPPILFEFGRPRLRAAAYPILDEVAAILAAHPAVRLEIGGHYRDDRDRDLRLSQGRADEVRDYLVRRGVAADRLEARGYGDAVPQVQPASDPRNARIALRRLTRSR